jgi:Uma2 family endonuclease
MGAESIMSMAQLRELVNSASVVGLTLDQYVRMIQEGILPEGEPIELLDGFLVRKDRAKAGEDPTTLGFEHVWAVKNLGRVLTEVERHGCHVALQQPIALPPDGAPEPDAAIVRGTADDYRSRYPGAGDLPCVIEVADSSLQHDRVTKKRIYARGGIGQYVIINLVDRVIEVSQGPIAGEERYGSGAVLRAGEVVRFSIGDGRTLDVQAASLLP